MSSPPRIAFVHDWLTGMRGGEKVLEAMLRLAPAAPIYTLFHFAGSVSPEIESHPIRTSFLQYAPGIRRHYRNFLPLFPTAVEEFDLGGFDLVVSSSHCVAKGCLPPPGATHICYCYTPMRYAWDQQEAYFPRRGGVVGRLRGLILAALRRWDVKSAARVHRFVADSSFVAGRIRRYYGREAEVLHPPVDTEFFIPGEGAPGKYALIVSALAPYKRIDLAIAACERQGLELRIVGSGPERTRLARIAGERTRFLGRVEARELRALYRGAACLLQPGIEDFGISVVEALACGTPVVAYGQGGVLDIVEDGVHGVLYGGQGYEALAQALDTLQGIGFNKTNLRRRAEQFSAAQFDERFRSTVANPQTP